MRTNIIALPSANEEKRTISGSVEIVEHLPAHPRAYVLRPISDENDIFPEFQAFTYKKTDWVVYGNVEDSAYSIVVDPKHALVQRDRLVAVGKQYRFTTQTESEYARELASVMEFTPYFADYIYEEATHVVHPVSNRYRAIFEDLFRVPKKVLYSEHTLTFFRLRVRLPLPKNVFQFDCRKRGTRS